MLHPNPFYRTSRPPFSLKAGLRRRAHHETVRRNFTAPLTPEAMESDGSAYVDFLAAQKTVSDAQDGRDRTLLHGREALRTLLRVRTRSAQSRRSTAGGYFSTGREPASVLPRVKAHLYFGHATTGPLDAEGGDRKFEAARSPRGAANTKA